MITIQRVFLVFVAVSLCAMGLSVSAADDPRPNILWITIEDWGPDLSCYGTKGIHTPHVDQLAAEGIRYKWAFTTSPVCSTSRSAMMTGFHQNFIRANQHREHDKQPLPHGIKPIPHLMKEAGYFTALLSNKTDCNFIPDRKDELFDGTDWNQRAPGQPFFARITFGGTHRKWNRDPQRPIDENVVEIPPYYVDTPFIRRDWANGYEQMQLVDREVGQILQRLDDEGLKDNTIVFFIGDHGRCHIRGKQFLYDGGIRIPMIMRWPGHVPPGQVSDDLVMSIDICATILQAAGATSVVPLHGSDLLGETVKQRQYVFAARDKMDETHDAMRAVRSLDHKLILNLMPERPYCQFNRYKEGAYPALAEMNVLHLQGKLNPEQARFFANHKPEVELYDLRKDPHEVHNVADDPEYATIKKELRATLEEWRTHVIGDQGVTDEFRATHAFPQTCPESSVDVWLERNPMNLDFDRLGWPAWYPTRPLAEWQAIRERWEPYVMRGPSEVIPRPISVYPKKRTLVVEDPFVEGTKKGRQLLGGDWVIRDGVASAAHATPPGEAKKKHGPKLVYESEMTNGTVALELKPSQADSVVITLGAPSLTHVFRVRVNVTGGAKDIQESYFATYPEKEPGARKAKPIMLLTQGIPDLQADQWNKIQITCLNDKAVVTMNGKTWTVYHQRIDQVKPLTRIELQSGSISLREFRVTSM